MYRDSNSDGHFESEPDIISSSDSGCDLSKSEFYHCCIRGEYLHLESYWNWSFFHSNAGGNHHLQCDRYRCLGLHGNHHRDADG